MLTPTTPLAGLTLADVLDYFNQSPGTATGFTISALDAVVNPETELDGALHEVETPNGPAVNSYKNKKLTSEQLIAYLNAKLSFAGGASGAPQWARDMTYALGALAYDLGITYRAKSTIVNSTVAPGTDTTNWEPVGSGAATSGAPQWVAGPQKQYALVSNAGKVFLVLQNIANGQAAPTATNQFYLLVGPTPSTPTTAPQWVSGTSFVAGALVYDQGIIYRAKQAIANSTTAPGSDAANWLAPPSGTGAGADSSIAAPVEYTVTVGQTSITSGQLPALSNATAILHIGNAASDGHLSPEFKERPTQASTDPGYWFDRGTHTLYFSAGLLDKAYTLSIKYATGVVGAPGGPTIPTRDPYDVSTAKALQVIADYQSKGGPFTETDSDYYGREFTDDYTQPGDEFVYACKPRRPLPPTNPSDPPNPTEWKWGRYLEAGI